MTVEENLVRVALQAPEMGEQREVLLAQSLGGGRYRIQGIPAFVYGLGNGDVVELADAEIGTFRVLRSGELAIRIFVSGSLDGTQVHDFIKAVTAARGTYEIGKNSPSPECMSLLLVSLSTSLGFGRIESMLSTFKEPAARWEYGNVYDGSGRPLNWWQ